MATTQKLRKKLITKLTELFQLDQPDLDFGFYRIMHAKAQQVKSFIENDLLQIIVDAFGQVDETRKSELAAAVEKAIQTAKEFGAPNPEETEPVKKAKTALEALRDGATAESDVYDHLYRFFERYYDEGDFISLRYYAKENAGKAAPYAIPYNGEEVKLHWANADQYYIKTAEYFSNFSFDLAKTKEVQKLKNDGELGIDTGIPDSLKVHFRIIDAGEGEHGNVKAAEEKKRFFILHEENPVEFNDADELLINFEYKALPSGKNTVDADTEKALKEKFGKSLNKGDMPNLAIADKVIELLSNCEKHEKHQNYLNALTLTAPTEKIKNRPLLVKYINRYTARNTCDYFIHKNLGGFLKRELDFYIKNEVMHLDDIENADAPAVENYLVKLKVIRRIATKLIDFLAQLEDFQKKLWIKKKFVTETNYCITLDRIFSMDNGELTIDSEGKWLLEQIANNDTQIQEWIKLGFIEENEVDNLKKWLRGIIDNGKLTMDNGDTDLFGNPDLKLSTIHFSFSIYLVLDTAFFRSDFKARLIASIEDFDKQCDGLLIHSENFQALNLLQERYREQVKCVYIDPPYNTGNDGFKYKDSYQHSSWLTAMRDKLFSTSPLLAVHGSFYCQLDHYETHHFRICASEIFNFEREIIWSNESSSGFKAQANTWIRGHDTIYFFSKGDVDFCKQHLPLAESTQRRYDKTDTETGEKYKEYFEDDGSVRKVYLKDSKGKPMSTVWSDIFSFQTNNAGREHISFSTQKPTDLVLRILKASNLQFGDVALDYYAGSGTTGHAVINQNRDDNIKRKYLLIEMADYFDDVTKPRIQKVIYSKNWREGKPTSRDTGISHCFKYIRLESYEDTLNNLVFDDNPVRDKAIESNQSLKEDYMLRYLLDVETRGSQSLLNIDAFADPCSYSLVVKKPGSDEQVTQSIDLIETFNYLLGLRLENMDAPQTFTAGFTRKPDPELPEDQHTKLVVDGKIKQIQNPQSEISNPIWWFRKLEGWVPADPMNPNNGRKERVLIVWRKLTGNLEEDNLMLDEWFTKYRISTRDFEYDTIYVNGSNNLPNLKKADENWKVRLIEEEFHKKMWEAE